MDTVKQFSRYLIKPISVYVGTLAGKGVLKIARSFIQNFNVRNEAIARMITGGAGMFTGLVITKAGRDYDSEFIEYVGFGVGAVGASETFEGISGGKLEGLLGLGDTSNSSEAEPDIYNDNDSDIDVFESQTPALPMLNETVVISTTPEIISDENSVSAETTSIPEEDYEEVIYENVYEID